MDKDKFPSEFDRKSWDVNGFKLLTVTLNDENTDHVIFLHGGAYLLEANLFHRKMIEQLVKVYGITVTFIDYPKAPEYTYQTTHEVVLKAYHQITKKYPGNKISLMGDSAGGGLALALLQVLRDRKVTPFPSKTILISPWLDISMSNPKIPEFETRDIVLPLGGLTYAADLYSGGEDLTNPLLSPLFGNMYDLGEIQLVFGTEELLYPDFLSCIDKLNRARGSSVDSIIGEGQIHDWIIFPLKESRSAIKEIAQFIGLD